MSGSTKVIIAVLAVGAIAHVAYLVVTPYFVMRVAMSRIADQAGGINKPLSTLPPTHRSRSIVKPSPDLVYTSCVFDISAGPVLVSGTPSPDYWSVALYAANSDNFHVVNDRQAVAAKVAFIIADAKRRSAIPAQHRLLPVVEPPTSKGIVLFRYLALDSAGLARAQAAQKTAVCSQL